VPAHPHLAECFGIAVAYRGLTRYLKLNIARDGTVTLEARNLGPAEVLAKSRIDYQLYRRYALAIEWSGKTVRCSIDGKDLFGAITLASPPAGGGVALFITEGRIFAQEARITALLTPDPQRHKPVTLGKSVACHRT